MLIQFNALNSILARQSKRDLAFSSVFTKILEILKFMISSKRHLNSKTNFIHFATIGLLNKHFIITKSPAPAMKASLISFDLKTSMYLILFLFCRSCSD